MTTYINKYMRQRFVLVQLIAIVLLSIFNFQSYDNFTLVSNILFTMEVIYTQQGRPQIVFDNWPAPPTIHRGLEWPQFLNCSLSVCLLDCSLSANFLIFLLLILLFYSTVSSVIGPLPRRSTED